MKRSLLFSLAAIVGVGALSLVAMGLRPAGTDGRRVLASALPAMAHGAAVSHRGYVVLSEAQEAHPLWAEVVETDRAIARNRARLDSTAASRVASRSLSGEVSVRRRVESLAQGLRKSRAEVRAEFAAPPIGGSNGGGTSESVLLGAHEDVAARSRELRSRATALISVNKASGEAAYAEYRQQVEAEYGPKLLGLRLRHCAARSPEEAGTIDGDIAALGREKGALLTAKEGEISVACSGFAEAANAEVRAQLKAFSLQRYAQVEDKLAALASTQADAVEAGGAGGVQLDISAEGIEDLDESEGAQLREVRQKAYQRRADDLRSLRDRLVKAVEAEVRRVAQEVSRRRGMALTFVGVRSAAPGSPKTDLTPEVIRLGG